MQQGEEACPQQYLSSASGSCTAPEGAPRLAQQANATTAHRNRLPPQASLQKGLSHISSPYRHWHLNLGWAGELSTPIAAARARRDGSRPSWLNHTNMWGSDPCWLPGQRSRGSLHPGLSIDTRNGACNLPVAFSTLQQMGLAHHTPTNKRTWCTWYLLLNRRVKRTWCACTCCPTGV